MKTGKCKQRRSCTNREEELKENCGRRSNTSGKIAFYHPNLSWHYVHDKIVTVFVMVYVSKFLSDTT